MLPILTKPLIQYGVEEALQAGITTMAIVTGRGKRAIEDHFDISYELEQQIRGTSKEHLLDEIRSLDLPVHLLLYATSRDERARSCDFDR